MEQIVTFRNDRIVLDTKLPLASFAKARFSEKMTQKGVLAQKDNLDNWIFSDWMFDDTQEAETVLISGKGFEGYTIDKILENTGNVSPASSSKNQNLTDAKKCIEALCAACAAAESQNAKIPVVGGGAIFAAKDFSKFIFLPKEIFTTCAKAAGDEYYAQFHSRYTNEMLKGKKAKDFFLSAMVYRILAGRFPFENQDQENKTWDMLDKNFVPLKLIYPANPEFSEFIDKALSAQYDSVKKEKENTPSINLNLLHQEFFERQLTQKDFDSLEQQKDHFVKKQNATLKAKRRGRKYQTLILSILAGAAIFSFVRYSYWKTQQDKPCNMGLTSSQVTEVFYSAFSELDVDGAQFATSGKQMKSAISVISNLYVSAKARGMYDMKGLCYSPAKWMCLAEPLYYIYGLTNFTLDGEQANLFAKAPRKKEKMPSLTSENEKQLAEGDVTQHVVHYYTVNTAAYDDLVIIESTDTVNLEYKNKMWSIVSLDIEQSEITISRDQFARDYMECLQKASNVVENAANLLRQKYPWVSTTAELEEAARALKREQVI